MSFEGILTALRIGELMFAADLTWQALTMFLLCVFLMLGIAFFVVGQGIKSLAAGIKEFRELFK